MIDYDSFSCCHLTDIFFRFSRGSERVNLYFSSKTLIVYCKNRQLCIWSPRHQVLFLGNLELILKDFKFTGSLQSQKVSSKSCWMVIDIQYIT